MGKAALFSICVVYDRDAPPFFTATMMHYHKQS